MCSISARTSFIPVLLCRISGDYLAYRQHHGEAIDFIVDFCIFESTVFRAYYILIAALAIAVYCILRLFHRVC